MGKRMFKWGSLLFALLAVFVLSGCGGSSSSSSGGGTVGTASLNLSGGDGGTDNGGNGGDIDVGAYDDILIKKSGTVDVSFSIPTFPHTFGDNVLTVAAEETVTVTNAIDDVAGGYYWFDGRLYLGDGDGLLVSNPDADDVQVTGVDVKSGGTLIMPGNTNTWFDLAVMIDGILKTDDEGADLDFNSGSYFEVGANGLVTTSATKSGGDAGALYLYSGGVAINRGTIEANGADGGGNAASVGFEADSFLYNTGTLTSNGGANDAGDGGYGDQVYMYAYNASLFTSGDIIVNGGGATATGGYVNNGIYIYGGDDDYGDTVVGGTLTTNGGDGAAGGGGYAGAIDIYSENSGAILVNAVINANGGDGMGAGFSGGDGGDLYFYQYPGEDYEYGEEVPMQPFRVTGKISLMGGNGAAAGGDGGDLDFEADDDYADENLQAIQPIEILGFATINLDGGDSTDKYAGDGGDFDCDTEDGYAASTDLPVGSIINEAAISSKGGAGYYGGDGGYIDFDAEGEFYIGDTVVKNTGTIDVSGGEGTDDYGGDSGGVYFYGHDAVMNSATITAMGGNGATDGGNGLDDDVEFYSSLDVNNSGSILGTAGAGDNGGDSAGIYMYSGYQTANSGALTAKGGDGVEEAGDGGYVDLFSQQTPTSNSGAVDVSAGAVADEGIEGIDGMYMLDWVIVSGSPIDRDRFEK